MDQITWTAEELAEFDRLVDMHSSRNQVERISGRMALRKFTEEHTKEKCDAMWAHLESGEKK